LIAIKSDSIFQLFKNKSTEGHPLGYFILIFLIAKLFAGNLIAFKIVHFFILECAIYLVLRFTNINWIIKLCISFGYFFSYEYSIISRNYGLGILLILTALYFLKNKKHFYCILSLALVSQTSFVALMISAALMCTISIYYLIEERTQIKWVLIVFVPILILSLLEMVPPDPTVMFHPVPFIPLNIGVAISRITEVFMPLPKPQLHFWETYIITNSYVKFVISIIIFFCVFIYLSESVYAQIFLVLSFFILVLFFSTRMIGFSRHHGFFFVSFVAAIWLKEILPSEIKYFNKIDLNRIKNYSFNFICIILLFQISASAIAAYFDFKEPFSNSANLSNFIEKSNLSKSEIIAYPDAEISPLSFYLKRDLYYPSSNKSGSFTIWDRYRVSRSDAYVDSIYRKMKSLKPNTILVLNKQWVSSIKEDSLKLIKSFEGAIVPSENYYIYQ
jgi:hypothetical protein